MAEEALVVGLTPQMLEEGAALLRVLDEHGLHARSAYWMQQFDEPFSWRLVLALSAVSQVGAIAVYQQIHPLVYQFDSLTLSNVSVVDPADRWIRLLRAAFKTGSNAPVVPFFGHAIKGVRFPNSYVYRST